MNANEPGPGNAQEWSSGPAIIFNLALRVVGTANIGAARLTGLHVEEVADALDRPHWLPSPEILRAAIESVVFSGAPQLVWTGLPGLSASMVIRLQFSEAERVVVCHGEARRWTGSGQSAHIHPTGEPVSRRWFSRIPGSTAHRLLIETASRLDMAIEAAEVGTFYVPLPMGIIHWNAQCASHFWVDPHVQVDFELFYARLHPDDRARTRAAVEDAVFHGKSYDIEYRALSPQGEVRWIRAKGAVRYLSDGEPFRFDGITIDISAQKRAEKERDILLQNERLQRAEAEQESKLKDSFIATVSHELRTPLNAIEGWVALLERKMSDISFVSRCVEVIKRNVRAQTRLVDDLLDVSRIAAGKIEVRREHIDFGAALLAEVEALRPSAENKGVHVLLELEGGISVLGDEMRLRQIFGNLLSNALRHTPGGGSIKVSAKSEGGYITATVADSGEGIPKQFVDSIFAAFAQVDGSSTRRHSGLGLGLAIAQKLTALHGGQITAMSDGPGTGAAFTLVLPSLPTIGSDRAPLTGRGRNYIEGANPEVSFDDLSILLVEDNEDALEGFRLLLGEWGVTVVSAHSAHDARVALTSRHFEAVFSDICMPDEDGYDFIRSIRASGYGMPAFAVTSLAREQDVIQARTAGFDGHLRKPLEVDAILGILLRLQEQRRDVRREQ